MENALGVAGVSSANEPEFVAGLTTLLIKTQQLYSEHHDKDWVRAGIFAAQQLSRTARFAKEVNVGATVAPLMSTLSPARAAVATLAVMGEKVAFMAGFSAGDQRVKCAAALAALGGNTAAMLVLGAGSAGLAIGLTIVSLASSLMSVDRECRAIGDTSAASSPNGS